MPFQNDIDWFARVDALLLEIQPHEKAHRTIALYAEWAALTDKQREVGLQYASTSIVRHIEQAGRPALPKLVVAKHLARRGLGSVAGRIALLHSLAHIEFNAINLALDAVYRFRAMPTSYVTDWLKVAADEGEHFLLVAERLIELDSFYGALPAHDGLWEMARRTEHDVLVRMALVPRILEARGLDVAPPMIKKLRQQDDQRSASILQRIYTDEITHVAIGNRWFRFICEQRSLNGALVFRDLLKGPASAYLRGPYNERARLQAGFTAEELEIIEQMENEHRDRQSSSQ